MALPPYDTVTTVLNAAKIRLNDDVPTLQAISGKLLDNTQPFSQQLVNNAWRKMQQYLMELGYSGMKFEISLSNVPACTSSDPITQVSLSYAGYFDGSNQLVSPLLPQNMVRPLDLWERVFAVGPNTAAMLEMDNIVNGLPAIPKLIWNRQWEWRDDAIYMPGATSATDLRIRFFGYFADFVDVGGSAGPNQTPNTPWFNQPVPVMQCLDSLVDYCCREVNISRGEEGAAAAFEMSARANAQLILNRDSAQPKAILKSSEYGKMQDRMTPSSGANTQPIKRGGGPQ